MFSKRLIQTIRSARKITVLTGAGISAESGVPTFRGEAGLWEKYRPEELANFEAFMRNPELVWEWYNYRKKLISEVQPNPGHFALSKMEDCVDNYWLITQNVDGLHRQAGNHHVLELHGNIMRSRCITCGQKEDELKMFEKGKLPRCTCGGLMRPDVVWFGEMLPSDILNRAFQVTEACDLFFSIGTSALVHPAAALPITALNQGRFVVEINVERTVISEKVHESIIGKSGVVLPQLVKDVWGIEIDGYD